MVKMEHNEDLFPNFIQKKEELLKKLTNIFLKEDSFVPVKQISEIGNIKNIVRVFALCLILLVVIVYTLTNT